VKRATPALVAGLCVALAAGCGANSHDGMTAPASRWLSAQVAAARDAATHGRYGEAVNDLSAIEASVHTFRSQHAIDSDHAARILSAVTRVRASLRPYTTTATTATTAPPATVAPEPGPGNGKHGHKGKGNEGD
jgi:hypothetical protein